MTSLDHDDICPLCRNRAPVPDAGAPDGTRMRCAVLRERIEEIVRSLRSSLDLPTATRRAVWLRLLELAESLDCPYRSREARRRAASLHHK